jgi:hypothetical protein
LDRKHRGAHSEHRAIIWLLEQGPEVFKNVSQHGPADIITWNPDSGEIMFVDVKTATCYKKPDGTLSINGSSSLSHPNVKVLCVHENLPNPVWREDLPMIIKDPT